MKKFLLFVMLSCILLFTACGAKDVNESSADSTSSIQTESGTTNTSAPADATETPTATPEPSATPEPTPTPTATPEPTPAPTATPESSWLADHQISITPQGDVSVVGNLYDYSTYELLDTVTAAANITITESTDGVPEGFKKVTATKTTNAAFGEKYGTNTAFKEWFSAFDRYTGYSFEATTGTGSRENSFLVNINGKDYDISFQFSTGGTAEKAVSTIEIICPTDYDGTVFQVGPSSLYDEIIWSITDTSERLYTIDEFPFFGENFLYFTYTDK